MTVAPDCKEEIRLDGTIIRRRSPEQHVVWDDNLGRRCAIRQVLNQAALTSSYLNANLKVFVDRLRKDGKPNKVIITAVTRKLVMIAKIAAGLGG